MDTQINPNIINANIDKLKKLSSQTGGKGTIRRKKKNTKNKLKPTIKKSQKEIHLEKIINRINHLISNINDQEKYEKFIVYNQDIIFDYLTEITKHDMKSKQHYNSFKDQPLEYFLHISLFHKIIYFLILMF